MPGNETPDSNFEFKAYKLGFIKWVEYDNLLMCSAARVNRKFLLDSIDRLCNSEPFPDLFSQHIWYDLFIKLLYESKQYTLFMHFAKIIS
jgi:hypothetical protein